MGDCFLEECLVGLGPVVSGLWSVWRLIHTSLRCVYMVRFGSTDPLKYFFGCYVLLMHDKLHPFMDFIYPNNDGLFKQDNEPGIQNRLIRTMLPELF